MGIPLVMAAVAGLYAFVGVAIIFLGVATDKIQKNNKLLLEIKGKLDKEE